MKIVGLGSCGCRIATMLEKLYSYDVYKIDSEERKEDRYKKIKSYKNPEDYEKNIPNLKPFFKDIKKDDEVLFIFGGGGLISGASLIILQQIKRAKISILYIRPETELLDEIRYLVERATFGVLQQYARSGVFERMIIVSNPVVEKIVGNLPITQYNAKMNETIVGALHMINVFKNLPSIANNFTTPVNVARIETFGVVDLNENKQQLFFELDNIREMWFYFCVPKKMLDDDCSIHQKLRDQIRINKKENVKVSYGLYETDYKEIYSYVVARSAEIQGEEKK